MSQSIHPKIVLHETDVIQAWQTYNFLYHLSKLYTILNSQQQGSEDASEECLQTLKNYQFSFEENLSLEQKNQQIFNRAGVTNQNDVNFNHGLTELNKIAKSYLGVMGYEMDETLIEPEQIKNPKNNIYSFWDKNFSDTYKPSKVGPGFCVIGLVSLIGFGVAGYLWVGIVLAMIAITPFIVANLQYKYHVEQVKESIEKSCEACPS